MHLAAFGEYIVATTTGINLIFNNKRNKVLHRVLFIDLGGWIFNKMIIFKFFKEGR